MFPPPESWPPPPPPPDPRVPGEPLVLALVTPPAPPAIFPLNDDIIIFPGHGDQTTIGQEKINNPFLIS